MSDWTPEDVDALFQEGSEGHEFEYNEAAWGQMENLLERRDRRRRLIWWFFGATMGLLLLVSAYFTLGSDRKGQNPSAADKLMESTILKESTPIYKQEKELEKESAPKQEKEIAKPIRGTKIIPIAEAEQPIKIETNIVPKKSNVPVKTIDYNNVTANELAKKESKQLPLIITDNNKIDKATEQKTTIIRDNLKVEELSTNTTSSETPVSESLENNFNKQKETSLNVQTALTTELAFLPMLPMRIAYHNEPIDFPKSLLEDLALAERLKGFTSEESLNSNHFVVGLLLSNEFSFVEVNNNANLKWKAGLSAEYRFKEKYALKLGINYSQKDYMTRTIAKYKVADGFWNKATAPNTALAICDVLEVSLSESYFLKGHDKRGFFINAGLTSYFLLKEQYNYTYDTKDPELLWSWDENNANRHWFGIGEVSVGYNLPFTDNSSLQIAPYAQIPLTGVGHGELKLFSSGVLIRYNFHLR